MTTSYFYTYMSKRRRRQTSKLAINELKANRLIEREAQCRENNGQKSNLYALIPCNEIKDTTLVEVTVRDESIENEVAAHEIVEVTVNTEIENQQSPFSCKLLTVEYPIIL